MIRRVAALAALGLLSGGGAAAPTAEAEFGMPSRDLGKAAGRCRAGDDGPALVITVTGLKDRTGLLRAELYPDNDSDFLASDKELVRAGKVFARTEMSLPPSGPVQLCIRTPQPGRYTLSLLHDRDSNRKFGFSSDGIGFPGNPALGLAKPRASAVAVVAGRGPTDIGIRMNYRRGLLGFGPLKN